MEAISDTLELIVNNAHDKDELQGLYGKLGKHFKVIFHIAVMQGKTESRTVATVLYLAYMLFEVKLSDDGSSVNLAPRTNVPENLLGCVDQRSGTLAPIDPRTYHQESVFRIRGGVFNELHQLAGILYKRYGCDDVTPKVLPLREAIRGLFRDDTPSTSNDEKKSRFMKCINSSKIEKCARELEFGDTRPMGVKMDMVYEKIRELILNIRATRNKTRTPNPRRAPTPNMPESTSLGNAQL